jgi:hypothetical protein
MNNKKDMSKMKQMLLATAAMCAVAQKYDPYSVNRKEGMSFNPDYKVKSTTKELREFTIKGTRIMAYSKKDAIKRLNHKK